MNSIDTLRHAFFEALASLTDTELHALPGGITFDLNVDDHRQQFGDFSTNAALILAKKLATSPRTMAQKITDQFIHPAIEKIEIAGPGFLNLFLTQTAYNQLAADISTRKELFFKLDASIPRKKYNIEFVSANPTGPLHLGNGRGGIIGDVLGNVLHFLGHTVVREFYINDAGNQIQKLGLSLKVRCRQATGLDAVMPEEGYAGSYLVTIAQECIEQHGPSVIHETDQFFAQYASQKLLKNIHDTLQNYGIEYDVWFSEKSLHADGSIERTLALLQKNGHLFEHDGALWFRATAFGDDKDRVMRKASGEYTYVAADAAYLKNKADRGFDILIMALGHDHHGYVERLKGLRQALGYTEVALETIIYQLVKMKMDGQQVRMSKRSGSIVTLADVIDTVGVDVARFFYLNRKFDAQLEFDLDLALKKTDENPVYYVQYAFCRTHSILHKAQTFGLADDLGVTDCVHMGIEERLLIKKIIDLKNVLTSIAHNHQTHLLAHYAIELSSAFHRYYAAHRIIDPENKDKTRARLMMVTMVSSTLDLVLRLLHISRPSSM